MPALHAPIVPLRIRHGRDPLFPPVGHWWNIITVTQRISGTKYPYATIYSHWCTLRKWSYPSRGVWRPKTKGGTHISSLSTFILSYAPIHNYLYQYILNFYLTAHLLQQTYTTFSVFQKSSVCCSDICSCCFDSYTHHGAISSISYLYVRYCIWQIHEYLYRGPHRIRVLDITIYSDILSWKICTFWGTSASY